MFGLLAAALGPASSTSNAALVLCLVVAFMTGARMVQALRHWVTRGGVVYLMAAACGVVLLGCGVLTLATAAIATTWIETEERRIEREILGDLRRQVHSLHSEISAMRAEMRQHLTRKPEP